MSKYRIEPAFVSEYVVDRDTRRLRVKQMCAYLREDLYERVRDPEPEKAHGRAVWESPLKNRCVYSYDQEAEHQPIHAMLIDAAGQVYSETDDATVEWLAGEML